LFKLLGAIAEKGSLKKATVELDVSYRFAWGLLGKWEQQFGQPLVTLERGRGATVTKLGYTILNADRQLSAKFSPELSNFASHIKQDINTQLAHDDSTSLTLFASHGVAINTLRDVLNKTKIVELNLHFHGSIESLHAMHQGVCNIAGFHIPEGKLGQQLLAHYQQYLDSSQYQLVHVVKRNQGLMCSAQHAAQLNSIAELSQSQLTFINRQTQSGTRLLFDLLLKEAGVNPNSINGYQHEEFTHMAVAAMIASGAADVGFGIAPMAEKFELAFIPMVWEHYCLAIPLPLVEDPRIQTIIEVLSSSAYQQQLSSYSGYECSLSGQIVSLSQLTA
jgi:molybdate transport repressor ModE-like protein